MQLGQFQEKAIAGMMMSVYKKQFLISSVIFISCLGFLLIFIYSLSKSSIHSEQENKKIFLEKITYELTAELKSRKNGLNTDTSPLKIIENQSISISPFNGKDIIEDGKIVPQFTNVKTGLKERYSVVAITNKKYIYLIFSFKESIKDQINSSTSVSGKNKYIRFVYIGEDGDTYRYIITFSDKGLTDIERNEAVISRITVYRADETWKHQRSYLTKRSEIIDAKGSIIKLSNNNKVMNVRIPISVKNIAPSLDKSFGISLMSNSRIEPIATSFKSNSNIFTPRSFDKKIPYIEFFKKYKNKYISENPEEPIHIEVKKNNKTIYSHTNYKKTLVQQTYFSEKINFLYKKIIMNFYNKDLSYEYIYTDKEEENYIIITATYKTDKLIEKWLIDNDKQKISVFLLGSLLLLALLYCFYQISMYRLNRLHKRVKKLYKELSRANSLLNLKYQERGRTNQRIGHEILSPLQTIKNIIGENTVGKRKIERIERSISNIQNAENPQDAFSSVRMEKINISVLMEDLYNGILEVDNIHIKDKTNKKSIISGDAEAIDIVFDHLLMNAIEHRVKNTPIEVGVSTIKDTVLITISNEGANIPEESLQSIFVDGYSTKENTKNLGQGLFAVKTKVLSMDAQVRALNTINGVMFEITFNKVT